MDHRPDHDTRRIIVSKVDSGKDDPLAVALKCTIERILGLDNTIRKLIWRKFLAKWSEYSDAVIYPDVAVQLCMRYGMYF